MITTTARVSPFAGQCRDSSFVPSRATNVSTIEPGGGAGSGRSGRSGACAHPAAITTQTQAARISPRCYWISSAPMSRAGPRGRWSPSPS